MSGLDVKFGHAELGDEELCRSIEDIIRESNLGAMSSVKGNEAHVNTAYFVCSRTLDLYFLSQARDQHSQNIKDNPSVAVAFWKTPDTWSENLQGVQIFGTCTQLPLGPKAVHAMSLFVTRFPAFRTIVGRPGEFAEGITSRMYRVKPERLRLLDEPSFGRRNYIDLDVR